MKMYRVIGIACGVREAAANRFEAGMRRVIGPRAIIGSCASLVLHAVTGSCAVLRSFAVISRRALISPTGWINTAQGNALGIRHKNAPALKGRRIASRAPSGLAAETVQPRALPWAVSSRPFGAKNARATQKLVSRISAMLILSTLVCTKMVYAETAPPVARNPETVIIPYDAAKPLSDQKLDQLYVPYEHFIELWNAAKANRRPAPPEKLDVPYVLTSSRYDARLDGKVLTVAGVITLSTYGNEWVSVPLPFAGVKISSLKLDGQPAALLDGAGKPMPQPQGKAAKPAQAPAAIAVERAGQHSVAVEFEIPLGANRTRVAWNIPPTAGTVMELVLPREEMKASISPSSGAIERVAGGRKIIVAALGSTARIDVSLDSSVALAVAAKPAVARIQTELDVTPAFEVARTQVEFSFPESRQDRFAVFIEKGLTLLDLAVPNLKSWKLDAAANPQRLDIVLSEPARDKAAFALTCERAAAIDMKARAFPQFSAEANRVERVAIFNADSSVAISPKPSAAFKQIPPAGAPEAGFAPVAAFSSAGAERLAYEVETKIVPRTAEVHSVYQVNHAKIEHVAAMTIESKQAIFAVTLAAPADFVVQAVESERLRDWWRDGDTLNVRFKGVAPGATHLVLHLVKQFPKAPAELEIKPLALAGFSDVHGDAVIAADKGVQVTMTALDGAKEVDPAGVAKDFDIVPPLERKRGIAFKNQTFGAKVALAALPARLTGLWIMFAQTHESWLAVSAQVNVAARQASTSAVSFTLPASVPEARVTGDNVREVSSYADGGLRRYWVFFRSDVYDAANFTIDFEMPHAGATRLPDLQFPELDRVESFVIAQNASDYEMQTSASGLDAATRADLPFLPALSQDAQLFRAHPGWSLEIRTTALQKLEQRAAFVAWVEMTTAIRENGSEWHRAVYHLQNRSLQFLPVKLPAGAELVTVRVAGESVRSDKGKVQGAAVMLVPLIKTKAGDLAYDVELVYRRRPRATLSGFKRKSLDEPKLVGITVERTFWNVWLPEKERLVRMGGNMEEVIEEVAKAEKLEGLTQEMQSLQQTMARNRDNYEVFENARKNWGELAAHVKSENESQLGLQPRAPTGEEERLGKGKAMQQRAYVSEKQQEVKQQIEMQSAQIDEARKAVAPPAPAQPVAPLGAVVPAQPAAAWNLNNAYAGQIAVQPSNAPVLQTTGGNKLFINDNVAWNGAVDVTNQVMAVQQPQQARAQGPATLATDRGQVQALGDMPVVGHAFKGQADVKSSASDAAKVAELRKKSLEVEGGQIAGYINSGALAGQGTVDVNGMAVLNPAQQPAVQQSAANVNVVNEKTKALNLARGNTYTGGVNVSGGTLILNGSNAYTGTTTLNQGALSATSGGVVKLPQSTPAPGSASTTYNETRSRAVWEVESAWARPVRRLGREDVVPGRAGDISKTGAGVWEMKAAGGAGGGRAAGKAEAKRETLQTEGRVSLPVDFPTEGRVYHFKKVKADAQLKLTIVHPPSYARLGWFALFVLLAVMLWHTARQYERFAARRRPVETEA
jgi:autotransporter-associated beta strand protein